MGNHMSCVSPAALKRLQSASDYNSRSQNLIKLLHCDTGAVSELEGPLTAAEVMMEFPAQFLSCFSNALSSGRSSRICAVPADEELQTAELYMLLPMHKLNTRLSEEEMAFIATLAAAKDSESTKPSRGAISQSKVAPSPASMSPLQTGPSMKSFSSFKKMDATGSMDLQGLADAASLYMVGGAKNVMCRSKSWIPKLETITESTLA